MNDSLLPEVTGFKKEHRDLKTDLISRTVELLREEAMEMKRYGISEDWNKNTCEALHLEMPGYRVNIEITKIK
jgi:hypothetical protein